LQAKINSSREDLSSQKIDLMKEDLYDKKDLSNK